MISMTPVCGYAITKIDTTGRSPETIIVFTNNDKQYLLTTQK